MRASLLLALVAACSSSSSSPMPDAAPVACNAAWGIGSDNTICDPVCNMPQALPGAGSACNVMQRYVGPCHASAFELDGKRVCCSDNGTSVWIVPLDCIPQ